MASTHHDEDVSAMAALPGVLAVVVPMAETPATLVGLHERLGPDVEIMPPVETAAGLLRAERK